MQVGLSRWRQVPSQANQWSLLQALQRTLSSLEQRRPNAEQRDNPRSNIRHRLAPEADLRPESRRCALPTCGAARFREPGAAEHKNSKSIRCLRNLALAGAAQSRLK